MMTSWSESLEKEALERIARYERDKDVQVDCDQTNYVRNCALSRVIAYREFAAICLPDAIRELQRLRGELIDLKAEFAEVEAENTVYRSVLRNFARCDPFGEHSDVATVADCDKVYDYAAYRKAAIDVIGTKP